MPHERLTGASTSDPQVCSAGHFQFAPVGYLILTEGGEIAEANLAAAGMLGGDPDVLAGRRLVEFLDEANREAFVAHSKRVFAGRERQRCELELRKADGKTLPVRIESVAFGAGEQRWCRTIVMEVASEREIELVLRKMNLELDQSLVDRTDQLQRSIDELRLMSHAVANLGEGVMITGDDLDWPGPTITFVNEAMCRITGYSPDEFIGRTPRILHGPKTDRAVLETIKASLRQRDACEAQLTNYRKDGTPYSAELHITALRNEGGRRTNFVSIHRDVTTRSRSELKLREREERLRAIMNATADAIVTIDRQGTIVDVNPATGRIFGYEEGELLGQNVSVLMPSPWRDEHDGYLARFHRTGEAHIIGVGREVTACRKDGSTFDADLSVLPVDGLGLFTGVIRDISRRRELEQEVVNASEEERQRIANDLHDDLGSLLTGIKLGAEALARALGEDRDSEAERSRTIVGQITEAIAKTRGIARGLRPVGADPEDLMSALRGLSEQMKGAAGFSCRFVCPRPVLVENSIVAHHLFRIAQEAVNNAAKHSGASDVELSLTQRNGAIELKICDNGDGFDPVESGRMGLGLHIMNYRSNAMNGTLGIERVGGGGTSVTCLVPLRGLTPS